MINPYFCYAIAFTVALLVYLLGWSNLYPPLSPGLLSFLLLSVTTHAVVGTKFSRSLKPIFTRLQAPAIERMPLLITSFLYILWIAEFVYEGGIPLIKIVMNQPYDYRLFGIPSLHVFIVTFSSFYTVFLFHLYLSSRKSGLLLLFFVNLFAAILIYSRAMFFFNAAACFFMVLTYVKLPMRALYAAAVCLAGLLYFFGVMGTLRVSREAGTPYDNRHFLEIGDAKQTFTESIVPKEYFWAYIYMTSPVANLQYNIDTYPLEPASVDRLGEMINNEILMDFISKRINKFSEKQRIAENTIPRRPFNVSTVYSRSYSYLGWTGILIMALVVLVIPVLYAMLVPRSSPFFLTGFVILCVMYLFLAYDNTIRFTGLSFQLVYPIVFHYTCKRLPRVEKIFL